MCYGELVLVGEFDCLVVDGVCWIVVLLLYLQYFIIIIVLVEDWVDVWQCCNLGVIVSLVCDYLVDFGWVEVVVGLICCYWEQYGCGQKLMFFFYGILQCLVDVGDLYLQCCEVSVQVIVNVLGLDKDDWQMGYQLCFGCECWLQLYVEFSLWVLVEFGVKQIDVVCFGFVIDCLEMLEEVVLGFIEILVECGVMMCYIFCFNVELEYVCVLVWLVVFLLV